MTDAQGNFTFANLAPGNYVLRVQTPAGSRQTTAPASGSPLTLRGGQPIAGLQLGQTTTAALSGRVLLGSAGLPGWTVLLASTARTQSPRFTATTDASGAYTFPAVPAGPYRLSVVQQPGYTTAARSVRSVTVRLAAGKVAGPQNFVQRLLAATRRRLSHRKRQID
jgi:hypothetical protein